MQENLLGYLLGALDGPEHEEVRRELERQPQLREQLEELEARLSPLEEARWQHEPPTGLAAATCQLVAEQSSAVSPKRRYRGFSQTFNQWNPHKHGWDMIDAAVAAGIFFAAALLFFPAIANSRYQARRLACQNNLRNSSTAAAIYGDWMGRSFSSADWRNSDSDESRLSAANLRSFSTGEKRLWRTAGSFPYIPSQGKTGVAGFYAPQLVDSQLVTDHSTFLCPSSSLMTGGRQGFHVPSIDQIEAADGEKLMLLQQTMGGSYMFTMGHFSGRGHRGTTSRGRSYFPIMADAFFTMNNGVVTLMHGGEGMNIAFEDGSVRFIVKITQQHPYFVSDRGMIEAGCNAQDAVLGHSWNRPVPFKADDTPGLWEDLEAQGILPL